VCDNLPVLCLGDTRAHRSHKRPQHWRGNPDSKAFEPARRDTHSRTRTRVEDVRLLGDTEVGRFTFSPGWRCSECSQSRYRWRVLPGRP
jgi:hypothetical protein